MIHFLKSLALVVAFAGFAVTGAGADTVEPNTNRAGGDYRAFGLPKPDPQLCRSACLKEQACQAWTYVDPQEQQPAAWCWLKNEVTEAADADCCTSGVKNGNASDTAQSDRPSRGSRGGGGSPAPAAASNAPADNPQDQTADAGDAAEQIGDLLGQIADALTAGDDPGGDDGDDRKKRRKRGRGQDPGNQANNDPGMNPNNPGNNDPGQNDPGQNDPGQNDPNNPGQNDPNNPTPTAGGSDGSCVAMTADDGSPVKANFTKAKTDPKTGLSTSGYRINGGPLNGKRGQVTIDPIASTMTFCTAGQCTPPMPMNNSNKQMDPYTEKIFGVPPSTKQQPCDDDPGTRTASNDPGNNPPNQPGQNDPGQNDPGQDTPGTSMASGVPTDVLPPDDGPSGGPKKRPRRPPPAGTPTALLDPPVMPPVGLMDAPVYPPPVVMGGPPIIVGLPPVVVGPPRGPRNPCMPGGYTPRPPMGGGPGTGRPGNPCAPKTGTGTHTAGKLSDPPAKTSGNTGRLPGSLNPCKTSNTAGNNRPPATSGGSNSGKGLSPGPKLASTNPSGTTNQGTNSGHNKGATANQGTNSGQNNKGSNSNQGANSGHGANSNQGHGNTGGRSNTGNKSASLTPSGQNSKGAQSSGKNTKSSSGHNRSGNNRSHTRSSSRTGSHNSRMGSHNSRMNSRSASRPTRMAQNHGSRSMGGMRGGGMRSGGGMRGGGRRSDIRLKHDIVALGQLDNGLGLYRFRYKEGAQTAYVGVMAQEVQKVMPSAVSKGRDGYLRVNYISLGVEFMTWDEWLATREVAGLAAP